jgi:DNA (cytosine-5)-methyltransferase 1
MWREMARIIGEVRPRFAFVENSPMLVTRGLERVLADLTSMGYDSRWGVISAADIGAAHKRERIWICSHAVRDVGYAKSTGFSSCFEGQGKGKPWGASIGSAQWWQIEPPVDRVADGMADRVDRLKAIGNGQVPLCAATAWKLLR